MRKHLKPFRFNITSQHLSKELACLGFKVSGFDVYIRKGSIQVDANYAEQTEKDEDFCYRFEAAMKEGPLKAFEELRNEFPEV